MNLNDLISYVLHGLGTLVSGIMVKVIILAATNVHAATTSTDQYSLESLEGPYDSSSYQSHFRYGGCYE